VFPLLVVTVSSTQPVAGCVALVAPWDLRLGQIESSWASGRWVPVRFECRPLLVRRIGVARRCRHCIGRARPWRCGDGQLHPTTPNCNLTVAPLLLTTTPSATSVLCTDTLFPSSQATVVMAIVNWRTINIDALDPDSPANFDLSSLTPAVAPVSTADVQNNAQQIRQLLRGGDNEGALQGALENPPYGADDKGKVRPLLHATSAPCS
jgi:hypothetical protein